MTLSIRFRNAITIALLLFELGYLGFILITDAGQFHWVALFISGFCLLLGANLARPGSFPRTQDTLEFLYYLLMNHVIGPISLIALLSFSSNNESEIRSSYFLITLFFISMVLSAMALIKLLWVVFQYFIFRRTHEK